MTAAKTEAAAGPWSLPPRDKGLVVLDREPGRFLFGAWQNVSIVVWAAQMDTPAIVRLRDATAKVIAEYPTGRSCVTVVNDGVPLPTDEAARSRLVDLLKRAAGQLTALAVVAGQRTGFERSAFLSFHTNLRIATSNSSEIAVLETFEELARWLPERHARTGVILDPVALVDIVRHAVDQSNHR
jgi:hypothetical protein